MSDGIGVEHLLASAALPFGVVPAVKGYVDGGVADNLPIYPLISLLACDIILVIRANPGELSEAAILAQWQEIDRAARLRLLEPRVEAMGTSVGWGFEPWRIPENPVVILVVAPPARRVSLLEFFRHTMNFRTTYTIPRFDSGYTGTAELLSGRLGKELGPCAGTRLVHRP